LCGVVALYALLGFVAAPYAVKAYGVPALSERLRHPVFLDDVRINPFTFSVVLSGFEIQEPDRTPMLGFQELFVNFEGTSLIRSAFVFDEIRVTIPFGFAHIRPDGKLNLLGLIPPATETTAPSVEDTPDPSVKKSPLPSVNIRVLNVRQGVIEYRDDSQRKPVRIDVVPIEITLQNFSTRRGGENAYAFTAEVGNGETLDWEGEVHLEPLESSGRVSLSNVKLNTFWPSIRDRFRFDILSGSVRLDAQYRVDMQRAPVNLQLSDGRIVLSDFRLAAAGESDAVLTIPSLELEAIRLDLPKRDLGVQTIRLTGADIRAWLAPDGVLNFTTLLAPVAETGVRSDSKPSEPWSVKVHKFETAKARVAFEDRSLKTPAIFTLEDLHATVGDLRMPFNDPFELAANLRLNTEGTVEGRGTVQLDPLQADLTVQLAHIGLRPFQPYLDRLANVEVKSGEVDLTGEAHYRSPRASDPMLRYAGRLGVKNLQIADPASHAAILGWTALDLTRVALDIAPSNVRVGEVTVREPSVRLVIGRDGSTNIGRAMRVADPSPVQPKAARQTVEAAAKKDAAPTPIAIDIVRLSKLSATFVDESIEPTVTTGIQDLSGTISGLSSRQLAKAKVSLTGKIDKIAPIKIQGQFNPLTEDAFTNLTFTFRGVDLTAASPYAGKYAGYPITKGQLSLDLTYQVSKKQLVGENKVLIDQFTFGEATHSPDATGLPVRLAVALLKDRRGLIDIDMPVRGDLSEPDFRYGGVVLNALVNVISKVATSPFAALGGLVGGGGDDLQFIEFQFGADTVETGEQQKIESIAKALQERPALRVEVIGAADLTRDRDALALQKMSAEVQRRFTKGGTKNLNAEPSPEREFEFLSDLYAEKLGQQPTKREELPGGKVVERVLAVDELRRQLIPAMTVEESELRTLAQSRAKAIREQLVQQGRLPEERVFLVEVELKESGGEKVKARLNLIGN
jgi:uncharacterized protein involved in outer membrane biogenesis